MKLNLETDCCCGLPSGTNADNCERCQLIAEVVRLREALREMLDFGNISTHWRYSDRSEQAFLKAAQILKEANQ